MSNRFNVLCSCLAILLLSSCSESEPATPVIQDAVLEQFNGRIDLENLPNYSNQSTPNYIRKDNTGTNVITNAGATLGRVLFYDNNLSANNSISCSSCHQQAFAFGDPMIASNGVNGTTGRHSMRLINSRFGEERNFFWDERAATLEAQTTQPIQDHVEMGFSGDNGDPDFSALIERLEAIDYYRELFTHAYQDERITEERIQNALAQFIRSIQSFDAPYDLGRTQVNNDNDAFPNFTSLENEGKDLFMSRPIFNANGVRIDGGIGCNACHRAPEFDIDPDSRNNGIIASLEDLNTLDTDVTRSPTLRDLFNTSGQSNGPLMHTGFSNNLEDALEHYNAIPTTGNNLDRRLAPGGSPQQLALTANEKEAIVAFIKTLSGNAVYTDEKWSDPFFEEE